jgi:NAD(P)H-dependent FMN reductase
MTKILGLAGSLREKSYNAALLRASARLAPEGCQIEVGSIRGIPLYDGDLESELGVPDSVGELKDRIAASDGLLLVTPEYNHSVPGVFKNAVDWLSRPPKDVSRVFHGRPVGLMGATPGGGGTQMAQTAWLPVLRALGMRLWFGKSLRVARAGELFDQSGNLTDESMRDRLRAYVEGFAEFASKR